ncbi:RNA polymerase sigma factor [Planctomycetota bacterium]
MMLELMQTRTFDQELLHRYFHQGDDQAFADFYDRYQAELCLYLCAMLASEEAALEVMQEIFLSICGKPEAFINADNLRAYLFATAGKLARRKLRSRIRYQKAKERALDNCINTDAGDNSIFSIRENLEKLGRALMTMPIDQRELVILHVYDGLTFRDIESITGIRQKTLFSRYQAALKKLKTILQELGIREE